jgi:hypothetical protein
MIYVGKTRVAMSMIGQFLKENEGNRAVYVGLSQKQAN